LRVALQDPASALSAAGADGAHGMGDAGLGAERGVVLGPVVRPVVGVGDRAGQRAPLVAGVVQRGGDVAW